MPTAAQATSARVSRSTAAVSRNEFAFCRRCDSGTTTWSSVMSAFCTMRRLILRSIFVAVYPGVEVGTMKPLTWPSSTSFAQMIVMSENVALPIQRLAPFSTH